MNLDFIGKKKVANPYLFRGTPMVTTFLRSAGIRTKAVWKFLEKAELEPPTLKKMLSFCSGRGSIYVHPCFYRSLKLRDPIDVGGVSRDGRVTTELGTGSLRHAVGILIPRQLLDHSRQ